MILEISSLEGKLISITCDNYKLIHEDITQITQIHINTQMFTCINTNFYQVISNVQ